MSSTRIRAAIAAEATAGASGARHRFRPGESRPGEALRSSAMASDKRPAPTSRTGGGSSRGKKKGPTPRKGPATPPPSTRYTPPIPKSAKSSPLWVPILMFTLLGLGVVVIFLHYTVFALPGADSNWWLLGGLGFILAGIIVATQYR